MSSNDDLRFSCICGEGLEMPGDMAGETIDCPFCARAILVPAAGEPATEVPAETAPEIRESHRCPLCASPCFEDRCKVCGQAAAALDQYSPLPECEDQDVVSPASADWIVRKFAWLLGQVGYDELSRHSLILPTPAFFPKTWSRTQEALDDLVNLMQRYAGLEAFPLGTIVLDDSEPRPLVPDVLNSTAGAAGCFYVPVVKEDGFWITLASDTLADPMSLVGTLGHELGHLFVHGSLRLGEAAPGRDYPGRRAFRPLPPDHEHLTDLVTVLLGFGVLTCESAFRFKTWASGNMEAWSVSQKGYLSQADLSFALALYCGLREAEPDLLVPHLGANSREYFKRSLRFFRAQDDLVRKLKAGRLLG